MTAFGDYEIGIADDLINAALAVDEKVTAPAQFTRQGKTSQWIQAEKRMLRGERTRYRAFIKPYRGARRMRWNTSATSESPVPMSPGWTELSYDWSDLVDIRGTVKWNMKQDLKHSSDVRLSVMQLVENIFSQAELDVVQVMNDGIMQPYTCAIAKVGQIYNIDGATFSGAAVHTPAFIQVVGGSSSNFEKGDVLDIYDSDGSTFKIRIYVHGVIHGENGPWSGGEREEGIGPGILAEPCNADGSGTGVGGSCTTAWNTVAVPDANGDFLARSGEFDTTTTTAKNFHGLPDWFDTTVDCLADGDGTAIDREATGNEWMNPLVIIPDGASAGSEVEFSVSTHLSELARSWYVQVQSGRRDRAKNGRSLGTGMPGGKAQGIAISEHLVAICEPQMLEHITENAGDSQRFTHASLLNEAAAKALQLIGVSGYEGYVWHSPQLGEVAFHADTNCTPHTIYFIEPSSFFWIQEPGGQRLGWISNGSAGRVWGVVGDTLKTPTYTRQAACHVALGLKNDQPQANAVVKHVCTAAEAA